MSAPRAGQGAARGRSDPWTDLALTLPIMAFYHVGVVFVPMRNAADLVTEQLARLAENSVAGYLALTGAVAGGLVLSCVLLGRGSSFKVERFALVIAEGTLYAVAMRLVASQIVGRLRLSQTADLALGPLDGLVMSLGAGLYEELAFRVVLFGLGLRAVRLLWKAPRWLYVSAWALFTSALFSLWHYAGPESFELRSFVFRTVCGLVFTAIYALRGFAPVVWTHALYDVWVLVL